MRNIKSETDCSYGKPISLHHADAHVSCVRCGDVEEARE
jgi:hypothetical protein